jgi:hypothetical protein
MRASDANLLPEHKEPVDLWLFGRRHRRYPSRYRAVVEGAKGRGPTYRRQISPDGRRRVRDSCREGYLNLMHAMVATVIEECHDSVNSGWGKCDCHVYPNRLIRRLGPDAPESIIAWGSLASLSVPMAAFLCSKETPGATILKAFDQAAAWRDAGQCVVSGFHSPLEKQCLDILLRGKQPIVMALARGSGTLRLATLQRKALDDGRLTIISPFASTQNRVTADLARQRNRFIAALADEVVFAYISPGGSLSLLAEGIAAWGGECRQLHP